MSQMSLEKLLDMIEDLQSRLLFQEESIAALDRVISEQDQTLMTQQRQLVLLSEKLKSLEARQSDSGDSVVDQKPPHY